MGTVEVVCPGSADVYEILDAFDYSVMDSVDGVWGTDVWYRRYGGVGAPDPPHAGGYCRLPYD